MPGGLSAPNGRTKTNEEHIVGTTFALPLLRALVTRLSPFKREEAQTFVEYALILAFIAILVIAALTFLQSQISSIFSYIGDEL